MSALRVGAGRSVGDAKHAFQPQAYREQFPIMTGGRIEFDGYGQTGAGQSDGQH